MNSLSAYRDQWFGNVRGDLLAGLVVALALIPEAIAFSIIAGVDPKVGLYASFSIAVIIAFAGGRPGMISAATAAAESPFDFKLIRRSSGVPISSGRPALKSGAEHMIQHLHEGTATKGAARLFSLLTITSLTLALKSFLSCLG
jgi:hypothetical protein